MRVLLTHSQKNFATFASLLARGRHERVATRNINRKRALGTVADRRRRPNETLLSSVSAAYIRATSKSQLTRVDVHMKNGIAETQQNHARRAPGARRASTLSAGAIAGLGALALMSAALAANPNKDQAKRMYDRIAGVPASDAVLTQMTQTDATSAALMATQDPAFYNNTIRNLAAPWTNRDQTVFVPLNDYTATVVGMVRDNVPFNTLLSADLVYVADAASNVPAYSPANNDMYDAMDTDGLDLKAHLVTSTPVSYTHLSWFVRSGRSRKYGPGHRREGPANP